MPIQRSVDEISLQDQCIYNSFKLFLSFKLYVYILFDDAKLSVQSEAELDLFLSVSTILTS